MSEPFAIFLILLVFIIGYVFIIIEPLTKINKTGVSLITASLCWIILFLSPHFHASGGEKSFEEQFLDVSKITTFILCILVIIDIMQTHESFNILTDFLHPRSKRAFLWIIGLITFFISTMIANVTATLIMLTLARRFLPLAEDRMIIGAGIVVASNAGGAWTPIGDITTTMLWISDRITTWPVMKSLFFPSLVSLLVTFIFLHFMIKGPIQEENQQAKQSPSPLPYKNVILSLGVLSLILIPLLEDLLKFPPYMGSILGVGLLWLVTDFLYRDRPELSVPATLTRIDLVTYFFFLGLLLSVRALDSANILNQLEQWIYRTGIGPATIAIILGLASAVVDNVPIVAASLGMYPVERFPIDSYFWQLMALCTGVGGSILIIGSPAGIAYMQFEQVSFFWFLKKITIPVLVGFFAGIGTYFLIFF